MKLPHEFLKKMKSLLDENEYNELLISLKKPRFYGLRVNTLKISVDSFLNISPFKLNPVPWTRDGFYYNKDDEPGKHLYYHAGLFYIQEPSAMLPAVVLGAKPGERILDLCAAPGGKTVQIAAAMKNKGLIVANDINTKRAKALVKNIELCGVRNALVTSDSPGNLAKRFNEYFDRILVDAPCSGEGMFRKGRGAVRSWNEYNSLKCSVLQSDILEKAAHMLKPEGVLVYSTCTFSPEENEKVITAFVEKNNEFDVLDIKRYQGFDKGRSKWCNGKSEIERAVRLWPHRIDGEGHFAVLLKKSKSMKSTYKGINDAIYPNFNLHDEKSFNLFINRNLYVRPEGYYYKIGNNLYSLPEYAPNLEGIKTAKFGWYLGSFRKDRFIPSHSMVAGMRCEDIKKNIKFDITNKNAEKYLKGETLMIKGEKGLYAVCIDGYTMGWAKQTGTMLKNMYPKGWRKLK